MTLRLKKIIAVFLIILSLCSCSGSEKKVSPILSSIAFTARINYYNEHYILNCDIDKEGVTSLCIVEPSDISGMKLIFSDSGVTAEYMGLSYTPKTERLPVLGVAEIIYRIISGINKDTALKLSEGENCVLEGRIDDRAYSFYFSPSGLPLFIEIPDNSFKIEFSDVYIE